MRVCLYVAFAPSTTTAVLNGWIHIHCTYVYTHTSEFERLVKQGVERNASAYPIFAHKFTLGMSFHGGFGFGFGFGFVWTWVVSGGQ